MSYMQLTKDEEKMLSGGYGEGYRKAIEILVKMGEFYDAKRLIPVSMAFLTSGPSPRKPGKTSEWLNWMADHGATFKCPMAMSPIESSNFLDLELHKKLGVTFAMGGSGHPRNLFNQPIFGQHLVADGTAVTHYVNSYIGARANTECFVGQYSAAIVGKTPEYGFHLTENRLGKTLFNVKVKLKDETDWSALGYYISKTLGKHYWDVPVINVDPADIWHDALIAICSSIPAYGSVVHSLLVGVSPEAHTLEQAFGGKKPKETFIVGPKELQEVYDTFSSKNKQPDMISIGGFGVNVSIENVYKLAKLLEGKKVSDKFPTVALIDGPVRTVADRVGLSDILKKAGVLLGMHEYLKARNIEAMDFSNNPVITAKRLGLNTLVFIDAKSCHYIGNQDIEPVLKNLEDCVKIALTGKMEER
ncbi:MAG: aconitase X [Dehalococcoidales bacterium]